MKKLFAVALILCLLIPAAVAEAPVDVKNLSDAELKALYKDVKAELMERKLWDASTLPAGLYQAGKGLPEGVYECIAIKETRIVMYSNTKKFNEGTNCGFYTVQEGDSFIISLYDEIIYKVDSMCKVRPFLGLDW